MLELILLFFSPVILFGLVIITTCVINDIKEERRMKGMSEAERVSYLAKQEEEEYQKYLRDLEFKAKLADVNRLQYKCPLCGYTDPANEFLTLKGKPTGEYRCRNCGKQW